MFKEVLYYLKIRGSEKASLTQNISHKIWGPYTALRWLFIASGVINLVNYLSDDKKSTTWCHFFYKYSEKNNKTIFLKSKFSS